MTEAIILPCNTKNPNGTIEGDGCDYINLIQAQEVIGNIINLPCQTTDDPLRIITLFCQLIGDVPCVWDDEFTGDDGDPLSATRWSYDSAYDYLLEISGNRLLMIGDYYYNNIITCKGDLSGDFEVGIAYEFTYDFFGDTYYNDIIFRVYNDSTGNSSYIKHHIYGYSVSEDFPATTSENYIETGGENQTVTKANQSVFLGDFTIKRTGTSIYLYFGETLMATFTDESYDKISITNIGYFTPNSVYVDDFIFVSGCPS